MLNIKNLSGFVLKNIIEYGRFLFKMAKFHYYFEFIELDTGLIYFFNHV